MDTNGVNYKCTIFIEIQTIDLKYLRAIHIFCSKFFNDGYKIMERGLNEPLKNITAVIAFELQLTLKHYLHFHRASQLRSVCGILKNLYGNAALWNHH